MARLQSKEIDERLAALAGWSRQGDAIVAQFERGDFLGSIEFVNRIAPVAEDMNHHPDLAISWAEVTVTISTHSEGGLTERDFALAERINELA